MVCCDRSSPVLIMTSVQTKHMTNAIAVQPTAWGEFDAWGCMWAENMEHAYRIAQQWGEPCMVWMCPVHGAPMRWCRATEITDAIADLVFGV
jgi:hypothetical protein